MKPFPTLPAKQLRAAVIAEHVREAGLAGAVAFSCGNATAALREAGLYVVDISPRGELEARRWWTPAEIARAWPHLFDATSGHLAFPLMRRVAEAFRTHVGDVPRGTYTVRTGSGETVLCLAMAYPLCEFVAVYGTDPATRYQPEAPLNGMVRRLCVDVVMPDDRLEPLYIDPPTPPAKDTAAA